MAKRVGFKAEIKLYPFKRAYDHLVEGEVDGIISIYYRKGREKYMIFSRNTTLIGRVYAFVKKGREFKFDSMEDLYGKKVGINHGWTVDNDEFTKAVREGKILIDDGGKTPEQNLSKLMSGRIDCYISSDDLVQYFARKMEIYGQISFLNKVIWENRTHIAISNRSRNITNKVDFMDRIDRALMDMRTDGTLERIEHKYFGTDIK